MRRVYPPPYYPKGNGVAEKGVHTLKAALRRLTGGSDEERLTAALATHRTALGPDGLSPTQKLRGRAPLTLLLLCIGSTADLHYISTCLRSQ